MYKITIEKITKVEYAEQNYKIFKDKDGNIIQDEDGYSKKDYFNTGKMLIRTEEEEIYTQITDKDIDIKKVIDAFNQ